MFFNCTTTLYKIFVFNFFYYICNINKSINMNQKQKDDLERQRLQFYLWMRYKIESEYINDSQQMSKAILKIKLRECPQYTH